MVEMLKQPQFKPMHVADSQISHPLLEPRPEPRTTALLVLTSNRGLCGGYNSGVLRLVLGRLRETRQTHESLALEVSGKRGINFLKFQGRPADRTYTHFEDKPTYAEVEELANRFIEAFLQPGHRSAAGGVHPVRVRLAAGGDAGDAASDRQPPDQGTQAAAADKRPIEYEFLPSSAEILEEIVPAAFKARLFKCFLDAAVSEQIFRRVAMKAATENAEDMIGSLSQLYNRARQTQITSELSEIIGGAAALE
jgi:F-type H+-transporting ATPase subunit gamma